MWPFKPKRIGFTDKDGVYKIKLNKKAWLEKYELNLQLAMLMDMNAEKHGRVGTNVEELNRLKDYAERDEPVPAQWLDPSIGTFRADSGGQPAKYPMSEKRG
jgi:hypothetical protein